MTGETASSGAVSAVCVSAGTFSSAAGRGRLDSNSACASVIAWPTVVRIMRTDRMASSFAAMGKSPDQDRNWCPRCNDGTLSLRASATALCSRLMSTTNIAAGILSIARMPSKYLCNRPASRRMADCSCFP